MSSEKESETLVLPSDLWKNETEILSSKILESPLLFLNLITLFVYSFIHSFTCHPSCLEASESVILTVTLKKPIIWISEENEEMEI